MSKGCLINKFIIINAIIHPTAAEGTITKTIKGRINDFIKIDKRIKITKIAIKTFCCILFHVLSNSLAAPDIFTSTLLGSLLLRG